MFQIFNRPAAGAKRILQIGFVTQDSEIGAQLKDFVSKRDGIDLRLIASASVTAAVAPRDISVFVYDLDATHDASLQEFDRFMTQRPQAVPVIVLSPAITDDLVRWFLRLRVADWIKTPLSPGELIAACGRVISQASPKKQDVKCLTVGKRSMSVPTSLMIVCTVMALNPITATRSTPITRAIWARALKVMAFLDLDSPLAGGRSGNGASFSQRDSIA